MSFTFGSRTLSIEKLLETKCSWSRPEGWLSSTGPGTASALEDRTQEDYTEDQQPTYFTAETRIQTSNSFGTSIDSTVKKNNLVLLLDLDIELTCTHSNLYHATFTVFLPSIRAINNMLISETNIAGID